MKLIDPEAFAANTPESGVVCVAHSFTMPIDQVFDAWLRPDQACKWLFASSMGQMIRVEIDPRVGGGFRIVDRREGEDVEHVGEYISIERPHRLVFEFSVPRYDANRTRVVVDFETQGAGCALTLTHEGVPEEYVERTRTGWMKILDGLNASLSPAH
jgi:uncharacterized protein YndB with AHSA1/START domain